MKLYLLIRGRDEYDEACGFVVRAKSPQAARKLAAKERGDEPSRAWLVDAKCVVLTADGPAEVVLRDFNAA